MAEGREAHVGQADDVAEAGTYELPTYSRIPRHWDAFCVRLRVAKVGGEE